jgi:hypothetical protein
MVVVAAWPQLPISRSPLREDHIHAATNQIGGPARCRLQSIVDCRRSASVPRREAGGEKGASCIERLLTAALGAATLRHKVVNRET